ncbi:MULTISPECIES: ABC transporter ATP-binding protein [Marivita]|uniref:ATP-binding cassette domain-containing protein n=1 Tax=Marivita cryptomonadis TaxID=505252 RepID=A0A9Q2PE85_9RHOB|nr:MULTISPECIES: oligopeptide/dipeptide ABC transporter ATP-binding protein [Marivita]MCR9168659.1 ATP-binding cassette domain-containing protein [Paracoccaceae bacterium]MBM2323825.1 ATP-binding cassette domain-containing protein [Marivita cryptomonadis]MBM2333414.1 ATP-binding cassette domain-containing protein [Marivita cryptomonadis]MBM2342992.1 ATP-binding cassette domain-containing protein [Marivita cryptomonadis]MBM2347663.1 ATP-binding cassette domain-containing protein [Marivita crypt
MALVKVKNLSRVFDVSKPWLNRVIERRSKAFLTAVSEVDFDVEPRSTYALVGESGSGKSTIGKMLVGLLKPTSGVVEIEGIDLASETDAAKIDAIRSDIQMIFQDPYASLNPRWRVKDIIVEPVASRGGNTEGLSERLLEQVGLSVQDAGKFPHEFSGGQRQRICIARALASEPNLIVCDEPTSALDVSVQAQVLNLMSDLKDDFGLTYVLISHDLTVVRHMADKIGVLYLGRLVEEAAPEDLFETPKHPYTQMLLEAAPQMDGFGREVLPPEGEIPDPITPPSGCAFHPRCPIAQDVCKRDRPAMRQINGIRVACHLAE